MLQAASMMLTTVASVASACSQKAEAENLGTMAIEAPAATVPDTE